MIYFIVKKKLDFTGKDNERRAHYTTTNVTVPIEPMKNLQIE